HAARRARGRTDRHSYDSRRSRYALPIQPGPMSTMRASLRTSLILAWIAALAALSYFVQHELEIGTDLRLFLPNPTTPEERLLVDEIGEGAGSRVLVLALGGASAEELADASRNLSAALAGN